MGESVIPLLDKVESYADIGCDDGVISKVMQKECFKNCKELYMFDPFSEENTEYNISDSLSTHFIKSGFEGDGIKDIPDESLDAVSFITSLHHIYNPLTVMKNVNAKLKMGGLLLIRETTIDPANVEQSRLKLCLQEKF